MKSIDASPLPSTAESTGRSFNFTEATVAALTALPGQRITFADAGMRGLSLRVSCNRKGRITKVFSVYRWAKAGQAPKRLTLGRYPDDYSVKAARIAAGDVNQAIAKGETTESISRAAKGEMTLGDLFETYFDKHLVKHTKNPCLNVNTEKECWNCWHCSWSGTLKTGQETAATPLRTFRKPEWVQAGSRLPPKAVAWFADRGIDEAVLRRNQVDYGSVYMPQLEEEVGAIKFPYFRGAEVINIKYRDGRKNFRMYGGAERILYGLNDIGETTIWVEGEIDKLSLEMAGYRNCVSVPDGAPAPESKSYASKFDYLDGSELDRVKVHILAVDNDPPGRRLEEELARRLGIEKCLRVTWPDGCKDANEVLAKLGIDALKDSIASAEPFPIEGAFDITDFSSNIQDCYENGLPPGASTGWPEVDRHYTVATGQLTIITGQPGHGKSEWLDALTINLAAREGWTFGMYSPENWPAELHIAKLAEKYVGKPFNKGHNNRMTRSEFDLAQAWLAKRYSFIMPESPTVESILEVARQLVKRKGIRGLVIDPWNEIEHQRPTGISETEYISFVLSTLRQFGRTFGVHVWVVAHPKMLLKDKNGKYPVPGMYDISGSAHWRNKADAGIAVWREVKDGGSVVEIHVQKVRHKHLGRIGMVQLNYERATGRYSGETETQAPIVHDFKRMASGEEVDL